MNDGAKLRICTFCGHNKIYSAYEDVKAALHNRVEVAIKKDYYNYFLIGNYGSFDRLAAAVCLSAKKDNQHIMVNLVVPYYRPVLDDLEKEWYSRFDSVIVPELEKTPYPYRIIKANEYNTVAFQKIGAVGFSLPLGKKDRLKVSGTAFRPQGPAGLRVWKQPIGQKSAQNQGRGN